MSAAKATIKLVKTGIAGQPPSAATDDKLYKSLLGSLMYAIVTRPDVATPVSMCARFMASPTVGIL